MFTCECVENTGAPPLAAKADDFTAPMKLLAAGEISWGKGEINGKQHKAVEAGAVQNFAIFL